MEKIKLILFKTRYYLLAAFAFFFIGESLAFCADNSKGNTLLSETNNALKGILENLATLLQTIIGLGALVMLVTVIFKVFKGEREAAEKLAWWAAGLVIGFVLISVVKSIIK